MSEERLVYAGRHWFIVLVFVLIIGALVGRMFQLMIYQHHFLVRQGAARSIRVVTIPAYRGMITDRHGEPLAISSPVESVWLNPKEVKANNPKLKKLARLLDVSLASIRTKIITYPKREFIYVKRGLNPALAKRVAALEITGIYLKREYKRYYPEGEVFAHVVGFTNIDDKGQEGLELAYNQWLRGIPGKKRVVKDRLGHIVEDLDLIREPKPGHDLVLSLDRRIQYLAYRVLKNAVLKHHAKSGSIVVLDPRNGEVLAMANQPAYNPNNRPPDTDGRYRNRAVTDMFEPGSTIKAFSVANALDSGKYTPDSIVNTSPGWMILNGKRVEDEHDLGKITVTTVLQKSSNMGASKLTLSLPPNSLWHLLHSAGFGETTGSHFPGESAGRLPFHRKWAKITLATLSFGYGISVTDLQLARAYAALADGGLLRPVTFLRLNKVPPGKRILSKQVAKQILEMLQSVIEKGGTATRARVSGYHVTGKTGTTRMIGPNGYEKYHHIAMFVGIAPVSNPRLVISVEITDPRGDYYGGYVAAPVFSKVMAGALRILNIPPDNLKPAVAHNRKK